jgi:hypothetical protein
LPSLLAQKSGMPDKSLPIIDLAYRLALDGNDGGQPRASGGPPVVDSRFRGNEVHSFCAARSHGLEAVKELANKPLTTETQRY